jgi:choline dehydrogenase-like flavoprotein
MDFDAIVIGSGISGGWAAKELSERGLKTLLLERGSNVQHGADYSDFQSPWEDSNRGLVAEDEAASDYPIQSTCYAFSSANKHFWVKDSEHPYSTPAGRPFRWIRGYHLGGRSLTWGRQTYRWSAMDFEANAKDGWGVDWPIRYPDLAPWYDYVEQFAGISGSTDQLDQLPDGKFQPAMEMNCVEADFQKWLIKNYPSRRAIIGRCAHLTAPTAEQQDLGRGACQYRTMCERGCSFGSYFSSLSATLPAAKKSGNLTVLTDAIVHEILYNSVTGKADEVRVVHATKKTRHTYKARVVFVCASTIGSTQILLNSISEAFPNGLANRSDAVGRYLMDHVWGVSVSGVYPGFADKYYSGRRPNGIYIPRYVNATEPSDAYVRGFGLQGEASRESWERGVTQSGIGLELKERLRHPGSWRLGFVSYSEMLPRPNNRVTLSQNKRDQWGLPLVHIDCTHSQNDLALLNRATSDLQKMLLGVGCTDIVTEGKVAPPGDAIHEMGTIRMGLDPKTSVLDGFNRAHDVPNLFVTDGACMTSSACQNPSLTYMAITARAAAFAAESFKDGKL